MNRNFLNIIFITTILMTGCVEPFNPPEIEQAESYLVVDGYVDLETGESTVNLSRTVNLAASNEIQVQPGAQVRIQVENGALYTLYEVNAGEYYTSDITLLPGDKCKLLIKSNGKDYESEFAAAKATPAIDSVTYTADDSGVSVEVTTHDPNNSTWFYQWQYEETGKYVSKYFSFYKYGGPRNYPFREREEYINVCWGTVPSTRILVGTSKSLTSDVIYKFPVRYIPSTSWKIEHRYSILVKQFAIDEKAYNYWIQLQKNTESLGTLFDPQPSQVNGNIKCVGDPSEPVLGYFSVRSVQEKRLYIDGDDLPESYTYSENGYGRCSFFEMDTLLLDEFGDIPIKNSLLIYAVMDEMGPAVIGYTTHDVSCIDCKLVSKGTTTAPEWWEE